MQFVATCAQIAPFKGRLQENLDRVAEATLQASTEGADLVVFPETIVSGYFLEGGTLECSMEAEEVRQELLRRLGGLSKPLDILVGFIERRDGNLYNSAAYFAFENGQMQTLQVYHKFFLATYGVFDDERFVSRGTDLGLVDTRFGRMAILICEDVWHSVLPMLAAAAGAKLLLVPSASPGRGFSGETVGNLERYERMLRAICEEHGVFALNCQLIGFEGGKGFVGGSCIMDPFGELLVRAPVQEESLVMADIDFDLVDIARAQTPLISDLQGSWSVIQDIVNGLKVR